MRLAVSILLLICVVASTNAQNASGSSIDDLEKQLAQKKSAKQRADDEARLAKERAQRDAEARAESAARLRAEQEAKARQIQEAKAVIGRAQNGDITAMRDLSDRYSKGLGVEINSKLSLEWANKAETATTNNLLMEAQNGNLDSMEALARRYEFGNGVQQDQSKAAMWREKWQSGKKAEKEADKQARIAEIEKRKFRNMRGIMDGGGSFSSILTTSVYPVTFALSADSSELSDLNKEIEQIRQEAIVLPAKWGSPDSMVARALDPVPQIAMIDMQ